MSDAPPFLLVFKSLIQREIRVAIPPFPPSLFLASTAGVPLEGLTTGFRLLLYLKVMVLR